MKGSMVSMTTISQCLRSKCIMTGRVEAGPNAKDF